MFSSSLFNSKVSVILKCISHRALTENIEEVPGGEEGSRVTSLLGQDGPSYVTVGQSGPLQGLFSCPEIKPPPPPTTTTTTKDGTFKS